VNHKSIKKNFSWKIVQNWQLLVLILPAIIYLVIFRYLPMYGATLAFKDFYPRKGIWGSPWVGMKYFIMFWESYMFVRVLRNTVLLSFLNLLLSFPFPIMLALIVNEITKKRYQKTVQMVTYIPYFISAVVMVSIIIESLHPRIGAITQLIRMMGFEAENILGDPNKFRSIFIISNIWQHAGYSSIIYIAALSSVSPELHEAAIVDGATKIQRIYHINLPAIIPTMIILLILNVGRVMNLAFEKVFLMQNNMNLQTSEIIATYVYKVGLVNANFSFATAIGLFNSVVNLMLILSVNAISRKVSQNSLW
jgi:putative aldouronate transport system permease protein